MATLKTKILHRNDVTAQWELNNPTLSKGEFGIEWTVSGTDGTEGICKVKIGDGATPWNQLNYFGGEAVKIVTSGTGNTVVAVSSATDDFGVVTYTLTLGNRLTGSSLTAEKVLLGNGGVDVKSSEKSITTTLGTDDTTIPTSKAVVDAIGKIDLGVSSLGTSDDDVVNLSVNANKGAVTLIGSHATQGPNSTADTTKGPSANVTVENGSSEQSIVIPKLTVNKYGHVTSLDEKTLTIKLPSLSKGTTTGSGNVITDFDVNGHQITATKGILVYTKTEVDNKIAAATNAAVIMRGTLGTGGTKTSLPGATAETLGDAYKVITAGTYASQSAKVGDVFICYTTDDTNYSWMLIPSGDDVEDTWRSVYLDTTEKLGIGTSTGALKLLNTANSGISISYDGGFKFDVKTGYTTADKNYAVQKDTNGNLYVNVPWYDSSSSWSYGTITPENNTSGTSALTGNSTAVQAAGHSENIKFKAANKWIVLAGTESETSGSDVMQWGHILSGVTAKSYGPTANVTGNNNSTIKVPQITVDAAGHITGVTERTLTLKNTTYSNVTTSAAGLAPQATANGILSANSSGTVAWNLITALDGGDSSDSGWGTITA